MKSTITPGTQSFVKLRQKNLFYIDKQNLLVNGGWIFLFSINILDNTINNIFSKLNFV